jgi:hypothetical protein
MIYLPFFPVFNTSLTCPPYAFPSTRVLCCAGDVDRVFQAAVQALGSSRVEDLLRNLAEAQEDDCALDRRSLGSQRPRGVVTPVDVAANG